MSPTAFLQDGLLTYLLHSTVLAGVAWIADKMLRRDALAARQALWRVALLGGILTAGLQTGLGVEPLAGSWGWPTARVQPAASVWLSPADAVVVTAAPRVPVVPPAPRVNAWVATWLGGFALVGLSLTFAYRSFRARIRDRRAIADAGVQERLRDVQRRGRAAFDVRLSECDDLSVPIAFGVRQREICVPTRALTLLSPEQQESLFAHELAHLVRHDPAWLLLDGVFSAVFFFQPLNWLVRRRLRTLSELACDTWAVETLGDPLALAGCLTEVAGWTRAGATPVLAAAIGTRRSHLGLRIERLLDGSAATADAFGRGRAWLTAAALAASVAWLAPGVSLADKSADKDLSTTTVTTLDDQAPPAAPVPPKPPRAAARRKVMPPVPPVPPAEAAEPAEPHVRIERDVRIVKRGAPPSAPGDDDEDVVFEQDQERLQEEIQRHAEALARAATRAAAEGLRNAQPQIQALQQDVERTVKAALEKAQREMEQATRNLDKGHSGLDEAARQIERQRKLLDEERARLDEERQRLNEERDRVRAERDRLHQEHEGH